MEPLDVLPPAELGPRSKDRRRPGRITISEGGHQAMAGNKAPDHAAQEAITSAYGTEWTNGKGLRAQSLVMCHEKRSFVSKGKRNDLSTSCPHEAATCLNPRVLTFERRVNQVAQLMQVRLNEIHALFQCGVQRRARGVENES